MMSICTGMQWEQSVETGFRLFALLGDALLHLKLEP